MREGPRRAWSGVIRIMTTQALNPMATLIDLGRSASAVTVGKPGSAAPTVGQQMNPIAQAVMEQIMGRTMWSGAPVKRTLPCLPGGIIEGIAQNLPPARLPRETGVLHRRESDLYPRRDLRSELIAYLGAPVKQLNVREANRR